VSDGPEPAPGTCPGCGAGYAGGGDTPPEAAAAALGAWGLGGDPRAVANGLFALLPDEPLARRVTVTSDRRDTFYRWWVFVAAGEDRAEVMDEVAARGA
jgi:hypothetical protein